ncbi:SPARC-like [Pollicipes pollicipes]|uniref:SPARC-like n=1 Tax=Pollicipes pollicipes TaxID=41117 RepID=UPI001884F02F|nr:SPARC-like [Pollicipes pollicipes]
MKLRLCLLLLLVVLLVTDLAEGKRRKGRRRLRKKATTTTTTTTTTEAPVEDSEEDEMDILMDDEAAMEDEEEEEEEGEEEVEREEDLTGSRGILRRNQLDHDPCLNKKCGVGRECTLTETAEPVCTCVKRCTHENDARRQVCTNRNDTWNSDCSVYKQRCECVDGLDGCTDPKNEHLHVDYYGQCRDVGECTEEEMNDFPRRMREWLFNVMKDLAERQQLSPLYSEMEQEAEQDEQKRWVNSAIWRWCELDSHPVDSSVSRHELFPIRATLLAMEHCIAPFLDGCDSNGDHDIGLNEWAKCLNATNGEIKERCERIKQDGQ